MTVTKPEQIQWQWVYVYEAHVIGIGARSTWWNAPPGQWGVVVLPDWMSAAFLKRLDRIENSDPIHFVRIMITEDYLIMGERVQSFELIESARDIWESLTPETHLMNTRIMLDGVLIWGREEYPGERQMVIPKVKIPKKLRRGIPALEDGDS